MNDFTVWKVSRVLGFAFGSAPTYDDILVLD